MLAIPSRAYFKPLLKRTDDASFISFKGLRIVPLNLLLDRGGLDLSIWKPVVELVKLLVAPGKTRNSEFGNLTASWNVIAFIEAQVFDDLQVSETVKCFWFIQLAAKVRWAWRTRCKIMWSANLRAEKHAVRENEMLPRLRKVVLRNLPELHIWKKSSYWTITHAQSCYRGLARIRRRRGRW